MADRLMTDAGGTSAYIANPDGTYSAVPLTTTEDGQVVLALNEMGIGNEGEDMVVIAADDNMDMATLENLIASGAVTTVTAENGTEYLQFADPSMEGAQIIELSADQMQLLDPNSKAYFGATGVAPGAGFVTLAGQPNGVTYRCPSCPAMYANANAFTKHMREKHFVKVYTCRQCEEFFETLSQLFLHARRSHVDPKKPKRNPANYKFHCDQCNYMTNNGGTMEHHKRAHTGEKPFVCDVCNKRFAQKANMKTHRNRHIHRDKIFRCETCNKAFSSYDIYLAHLRTREHELREHFAMMASSQVSCFFDYFLQLALECLGCAVTFDSIYNLNKHTRSCRIVRTLQTKFRCLPCNAYVSDVASLKAHVKAHEGSQIISCPVCGERGFPGFNQLNHHITRAHALKVNRRHVCRYCESTFEVKKDLDAHIRSMHAEERNARQSRGAVGRLKCRYSHCEFTTNSIMLLDRHHDQHRRQEEDGLDANIHLPPTKHSYAKRRRAKGRRIQDADIYDDDEEALPGFGDEDVPDEDGYADTLEDGNVTRRTITLIKSKKGTGAHSVDKSGKAEVTTNDTDTVTTDTQASRRMSRARRLPAWYKDYDTDFGTQEEPVLNREQVQAQLPPGIELEDPSAIEKQDVPTEEWNIVVYEDEEDEDGESAQDYVPIDDGENCDPDLLEDTASMLVT
ncbi:Zinc finger and SCAN domain-containing protein 2 [Fasciola gigantica]|uniref:Zinc finger and SCAN domain-containing protein 2 n=1 Tax=Fasciola gigantica TaxID=46835 RepID=A0A504Z0W1_FASGI|nr:Zinc finger and SCAN domain-containing protein 2 [Fasciola gigantica]